MTTAPIPSLPLIYESRWHNEYINHQWQYVFSPPNLSLLTIFEFECRKCKGVDLLRPILLTGIAWTLLGCGSYALYMSKNTLEDTSFDPMLSLFGAGLFGAAGSLAFGQANSKKWTTGKILAVATSFFASFGMLTAGALALKESKPIGACILVVGSLLAITSVRSLLSAKEPLKKGWEKLSGLRKQIQPSESDRLIPPDQPV